MTMEERYSYRLIRDLFQHKVAIFSELKRNSSLSHSISVDTRPRAISTSLDESNRKANMEARNKAILQNAAGSSNGGSRGRAVSPAPSPRGHRRDRSSGGPETRFPIQTSPPAHRGEHVTSPRGGAVARQSLEVPKDDGPVVSPVLASEPITSTLQSSSNGSGEEKAPVTSATYMPGAPGLDELMDGGVEKRNSLGRAGAAGVGSSRFAGRKAVGVNRMSVVGVNGVAAGENKRDSIASVTSEGGSARVGVSLTDKPMDD